MEFVRFMLARLKEPSTYGGLGLLVTSLGIALSPEQLSEITLLFVAAAGVAAAFLPEKKS